jgi:hypothetical protein
LLPLREHDPSIVLAMLAFAYNNKIDLPDKEKKSMDNVLFAMNLHHVAMRYGFTILQNKSLASFDDDLWNWPLIHLGEDKAVAKIFSDFVKKVYTLPADSKHSLAESLVELTKFEGPLQIFGYDGGASHLLVAASRQTPEFGRDLFLSMVDESSGLSMFRPDKRNIVCLDMTLQVKCPLCSEIQYRGKTVEAGNKHNRCMSCGEPVEDWWKYGTEVDSKSFHGQLIVDD